MRMRWTAWLVFVLLVACTKPPLEAYREASGAKFAKISLGKDSKGLDCRAEIDSARRVMFYCGDVRNASGRVVSEPAEHGASLASLASSSSWRTGMDAQFTCEAPKTEKVYGADAVQLDCTRRIGSAPRIALVTVQDGKAYFADADVAATDPLQRAIGIALGKVKPETASDAPVDATLAAGRAASEAITSGKDVGTYEDLMYTAGKANLTENFAEAERGYRLAADLLKDKQGKYPRAAADPLIREAIQLSNMGQFREAGEVFKTAEDLVKTGANLGGSLDNVLEPNLELYRALDLLNQEKPKEAIDLLEKAEAGFRKYAAPADLSTARVATPAPGRALAELSNNALYRELGEARAVLGVIAVKRTRAVALKMLGKLDESLKEGDEATQLTAAQGLAYAQLRARNLRTSAMLYDAKAEQEARSGEAEGLAAAKVDHARALKFVDLSADDFDKAYKDSRPEAVTTLLAAAHQIAAGDTDSGLKSCNHAIQILKKLKSRGVDVDLMMPCVDAFFDAKAYPDMFEASQLAQAGITSAQIAQAAARLVEAQKEPKVAEVFARRAALTQELTQLNRDLVDAERSGGSAEAQQRLRAAQLEQQSADAAFEQAAPKFGQLVQQVATADDVYSVLGKDATLAAIVLGKDHGWTLTLHAGKIDIERIEGGQPRIQTLVTKIRATMEIADNGEPRPFAADASAELYTALFGKSKRVLNETKRLIVAPNGPLLSLPFALLLTGPAGSDLSKAPWLVRDMTVEHVPSPGNFVGLSKLGPSKAENKWIGFGDPVPATRSQLSKLFSGRACEQDVSELSQFQRLPGTRAELNTTREELHGNPSDEFIGPQFTLKAVTDAKLNQYKVAHFATHGLMPTDLQCVNEAVIVASALAQASDASDALIKASQIMLLGLDADVVVLSACNSGGPEGKTAGESLSGLARSFFYAGARSLLVTHWEVNDQVTRILVAKTMDNFRSHPQQGLAAALATEERDILQQAAGDNAVFAHPYFWAPLALIGNGEVRYD